jgi:Zn-dependent protease/CBS domain-containing protein
MPIPPSEPRAAPVHGRKPSWSVQVARVGGVPVRIHVTFWLLLVYVWWVANATGHSPAMQVGLVASIFLCVLLHEIGHVLVARRFGIATRSITLYPIGGISRLESMGEPRQEAWIALVGPLVSLLIGGAIWLGLVLAGGGLHWAAIGTGKGSFLEWLAVANLVLGVFNLLPVFPMDGGRAFRALLALELGKSRATEVAARVGQVLAAVLGAYAFLTADLILILVAVFLFLGAQAEASMQSLQDLAHGHRVRDAMITDFEVLDAAANLGDAVRHLLRSEHTAFPVVTEGGFAGLVTQARIVEALAEQGLDVPARDLAVVTDAHAAPDDALDEWVRKLATERGIGVVPVLDAGKVVGLLTWHNLMEFFAIERALTGPARTPAGP